MNPSDKFWGSGRHPAKTAKLLECVMPDMAGNGKYLLDAILAKLASLSSGVSLGASAPPAQDIQLPNESGQIDPRIAASQNPAQRAVGNFNQFRGRR